MYMMHMMCLYDICRGQAGDSRGEAVAWRSVVEARMRLGKFKEALSAAEAAMVIAAGPFT